jgi:hypothetical protein
MISGEFFSKKEFPQNLQKVFLPKLPVQNHQPDILKIRPMSYFHDGHHMSLQRSSNTPSKKPGYFGRSSAHLVVHRVVSTTYFFARGKLGVENLCNRD